ncbi:unnamed protein product [Allacma fusca]|uniref:Activating signal cointegrator 1 n=1 Tax=Allacma fusca TaxID=39272 RepID=A0A8J2LL73_9HEXA|nr:unnamed protein product [Allacma fusca]
MEDLDVIMPPKKTKFVNINAVDCNAALLPGRHRCDCQATKHPLINNCLSCGRIVCSQEGKGPCFCCGELVLNRSERYRILEGNSRKTQDLVAKYSKLPRPQDDVAGKKENAVSQKEKLLEYDRTSAQRTKVIDDQADYFATESPWLSPEEKEAQRKKEEAYKEMKDRLRRKTKITIDFAGRRIIEESPELPNLEDFSVYNNSSVQMRKNISRMNSDKNAERVEKVYEDPQFVGQLEKKQKDSKKGATVLWSNRIQDSELQEMVDSGNCISIQQPYATLIVDGIKIFEGRTWYTPFRGRLWICAGSLLGCVDLIDCLPQEEYLQLYPQGEISDPYVWVLANPKTLPFRLPIQPKSKIFKMEMHVHQAAKRSLK